MKNRLLAFVLIVVMLLSIASCAAKPELNLDDAEENLKDEDYTVTIKDDKDSLNPGIVQEFIARSEDGKDSLYITEYETAKQAKLAYDLIKFEFDSSVEYIELEIKSIEFILENYKSDLKSDEIDDFEDELKELKEELEETQEDRVFGKSGKFVWRGTAKALEDSKG